MTLWALHALSCPARYNIRQTSAAPARLASPCPAASRSTRAGGRLGRRNPSVPTAPAPSSARPGKPRPAVAAAHACTRCRWSRPGARPGSLTARCGARRRALAAQTQSLGRPCGASSPAGRTGFWRRCGATTAAPACRPGSQQTQPQSRSGSASARTAPAGFFRPDGPQSLKVFRARCSAAPRAC